MVSLMIPYSIFFVYIKKLQQILNVHWFYSRSSLLEQPDHRTLGEKHMLNPNTVDLHIT